MPNVQQIIQSDNRNKLQGNQSSAENDNSDRRSCNCRNPDRCPVDNSCLKENVIYQANVTSDNRVESYVGLAATTFKTRFSNHTSSFNNASKRTATELSKYIWSLKDNNKDYQIQWKILHQAKPYSNVTKNIIYAF